MPPIRVIKQLYRNPRHPASFGGIDKVGRHFNLSNRETKRVLSGIRSYTTHRETKKPKYRNPFYVYKLRDQIQIDLVDVRNLANSNRRITFLLTGIDVFSKYLVVVPMKSKNAIETEKAMIKLIDKFEETKEVKKIMSDAGTEFKNQRIKNLFERQNITHFIPGSDLKCPIIERVNKTIQRRIYQYLTDRKTDEYIDDLQNIVIGYNRSIHSFLGISPNDAEKPENQLWVRDCHMRKYQEILEKRQKKKFNIGDTVKIAAWKNKFHRSYNEQQANDLYRIVRIDTSMPIPRYYLQAFKDLEFIEGAFYANELTLINDQVFEIEKQLKKRTYRGERQVRVKWKGYHKSFNEWIPLAQVVDHQ